jgi:uncharacterized repeat protein (TIGR01451 family)
MLRPMLSGAVAVLVAGAVATQPAPTPVTREGLQLSSLLEELVETTAADGSVSVQLVRGAETAGSAPRVYTVRFTNTTEQPIDGVRVTSAIPDDVHYVANSATGPGMTVLFSVDGGRTFGAAAELFMVDGAELQRAEPRDYTHIRWVLDAPLDAGGTGFARFRAQRR